MGWAGSPARGPECGLDGPAFPPASAPRGHRPRPGRSASPRGAVTHRRRRPAPPQTWGPPEFGGGGRQVRPDSGWAQWQRAPLAAPLGTAPASPGAGRHLPARPPRSLPGAGGRRAGADASPSSRPRAPGRARGAEEMGVRWAQGALAPGRKPADIGGAEWPRGAGRPGLRAQGVLLGRQLVSAGARPVSRDPIPPGGRAGAGTGSRGRGRRGVYGPNGAACPGPGLGGVPCGVHSAPRSAGQVAPRAVHCRPAGTGRPSADAPRGAPLRGVCAGEGGRLRPG